MRCPAEGVAASRRRSPPGHHTPKGDRARCDRPPIIGGCCLDKAIGKLACFLPSKLLNLQWRHLMPTYLTGEEIRGPDASARRRGREGGDAVCPGRLSPAKPPLINGPCGAARRAGAGRRLVGPESWCRRYTEMASYGHDAHGAQPGGRCDTWAATRRLRGIHDSDVREAF
jgi:hypothetical protein